VFTRCPGCQTVHSLNAVLLAQGNGLYRCGNCNKVSNALQNLFDNMPAEGDVPPSADDESRQLPVLGGAHEQSPDQESEVSEEEAELLRAAGFREQADKSGGERKAWFAAAIVLVAVTFANLFFVSGNKLMAQPSIRAALQDIGAIETPPEPQYRNLDMLHLASSEMHSPSRIFPPEQYLPNASGNDDSMPPGAYLPVIMELLDPGKHAVGFEMKFH
jgi:predicted Zn finger-like uncharacterized protein